MAAMTVRLPDDLHEWLRQQAFLQRTSIQLLVIAAIEQARDDAREAVE